MTSLPSLKYVREVAKGNEDWMVLGSGSARFGMVCVPGVCWGGSEGVGQDEFRRGWRKAEGEARS